MRSFTSAELALISKNKKSDDKKPILNLPSGASRISQEIENWLILLPNEVKLVLLWLIDQSISTQASDSNIELRLASEFEASQNLWLNQTESILLEDLKSYNALSSFINSGVTVLGTSSTDIVPKDANNLLQVLQVPVGWLSVRQESANYEARLNTYINKARVARQLHDGDISVLRTWRDVICSYTENADILPSNQTTLANGYSVAAANAALYSNNRPSSAKQKEIRQLVAELANSRKYPQNRLLAQIYQESKYNPTALNTKSGAAGLGQFMTSTGPNYGLKTYTSDYFDPQKSTEATIRYMLYLQGQARKWGASSEIDQWRVALGMFNMGIGNMANIVGAAGYIKASGGSFKDKVKPFSWPDIHSYLVRVGKFSETVNYIPKIEAYAKNPP
jgi:hypothetical protein